MDGAMYVKDGMRSKNEKTIWFHVFSMVVILIAIVMKIAGIDYPALTLVLWYFYIGFLYGALNVKMFWQNKACDDKKLF